MSECQGSGASQEASRTGKHPDRLTCNKCGASVVPIYSPSLEADGFVTAILPTHQPVHQASTER